jgi:hypothetical protein
MLSEAEYKQEWLNGLHQTDYNNCRFAEDKTQYAIDWVKKNLPNVNLENPQTLVDRINYYKIFDKDKRKTFWADKIMVRYMIEDLDPKNEEGLHDILIPTIYSSRCYLFRYEYDNFIPDGKYIIKCNHGSGWNIRFEKKPGFDPTYMLSKIKEWYFLNYAYVSGYEWQYENIIPGIIVQPDYGQLKDWNFWCENGEIKYVQTVRKLGKNLEEFMTFTDANGDKPDIYIGVKPMRFHLLESEKETLEKMKPIVKKLASDFKFVRVDLYSINGQVKFGETTFSPCSGKLVTGLV